MPKVNDEITERLAALCHEQWSGRMKHLFEFGDHHPNGAFTMNADKVERWKRQMETLYSELSEQEQESDRKEARKFLEILYDDIPTEKRMLDTMRYLLEKMSTAAYFSHGSYQLQMSKCVDDLEAIYARFKVFVCDNDVYNKGVRTNGKEQ